MILLDTHIWVWWVLGNQRLSGRNSELLKSSEAAGLGISIISCWEVAKLVENKRLELPIAIDDWLRRALQYPGMTLIDLSVDIVVESTRLPDPFHRDPADQMLVATARLHDLPLATADQKLLDYEHVETLDFT